MKKILLLAFWIGCISYLFAQMPQPKREFRGAWIQMVNGQFMNMSKETLQANLTHQLDMMAKCHVNTIIFQVRAEGDAFYQSPYEPWSRFFTGQQGKAPSPFWDPLAWMVQECHKRGMEIHAWINPYRAKTKTTTYLAPQHPFHQYPERFVEYDNQYFFNPGLPENRNYICKIVKDIVSRYDVDGIHIDDYFYPYPNGTAFNDEKTFATHSCGYKDINDWRRYNVNLLIEQLFRTIRSTKPWVKFGVSPFGIYHNAQNNSQIPGSNTRGLQNYDDLYADVLYWVNKGWVDYIVPQLYWERGHKTADYDTLIRWWNKYASHRPIVIGQDIARSVQAQDPQNPNMNQLPSKWKLQRTLPNIKGSCLWYSANVAQNFGNSAITLQKYLQPYPALLPLMPFIDQHAPKKVRSLSTHNAPDGLYLFWKAPRSKKVMDEAQQYVIYRFKKGEPVQINNPSHIVAITRNTIYKLPYGNGKTKYTYVVTALDRVQNESKMKKKSIKL